MKHVPVIAARELRSAFSTPVAYVLLAAYLVFAGFVFFASLGVFLMRVQQVQAYGLTHLLAEWNLNDAVIAPALYTFVFAFLVIVPLLTMRAFAEERATGSIELLLTSPITVGEIVLGKYLAVLAMVGALVGLTAFFPALLFLYGDPEPWQTLSGLLTLFLYGAGLGALGCFVSALTRSQIVAGVVGIMAALLLVILDLAGESTANETLKALLGYLGTSQHYEQGIRGQVRTEDWVYFGAMVVVFLSLARAAIDSLRWR